MQWDLEAPTRLRQVSAKLLFLCFHMTCQSSSLHPFPSWFNGSVLLKFFALLSGVQCVLAFLSGFDAKVYSLYFLDWI